MRREAIKALEHVVRAIRPTSGNQDGRALVTQQPPHAILVGNKGLSVARDVVEKRLQGRRHAEVVDRSADDQCICGQDPGNNRLRVSDRGAHLEGVVCLGCRNRCSLKETDVAGRVHRKVKPVDHKRGYPCA